MRVLLVEDDTMIGESLRETLRRQGMACDWVRDGRAADAVLASERFDAVLLDLGLPQRDGLTVLRDLRARGDTTPVIVLTARDALPDKVKGLDSGADDYLVKPFELDELLARLRALRRRHGGRASTRAAGGRPHARPRHARGGARRPRRCCSRRASSRCCMRCWSGPAPSSRARSSKIACTAGARSWRATPISVYMHQLRKKLGDDLLHTVRGLGYYAGPAKDGSA